MTNDELAEILKQHTAWLAGEKTGSSRANLSGANLSGANLSGAGWAICLAGFPGKMLEERIGPSAAGALIYAASRPEKPVPDFVCSNEEALADMRACAAENAGADL